MKAEIKTITPVRPIDVGDVRFEFRVELAFGEDQVNVDVTAEQLSDFRQFQQVVLAKTGILPDLGISEAESEFDAYRRWQQLLQNVEWKREYKPKFEAAESSESDDESSEPFYGLVEED